MVRAIPNFKTAQSYITSKYNNFKEEIKHPVKLLGSASHKIAKWARDPDMFYHVCIATFAAIHIVWKNAPVTLTKFMFTLNAVNAQSIYSSLKILRDIFSPITANKINKNKLIDNVSVSLVNTYLQAEQMISTDELRPLAEKIVEDHLKSMTTNDDSYATEEQLRKALAYRLNNLFTVGNGKIILEKNIYLQPSTALISFAKLPIPKKGALSLGEKIYTIIFGIIDIQAALFAFQHWKLIDTSKWAAKIGQYKGFRWVQRKDLQYVLQATLCVGFAAKIYEATRQLIDAKINPKYKLTHKKQTKALWNIATAGADFISNGIGFLNHAKCASFSPLIVYGSLFAARMVSIIKIATDH